jgi:Tfp pilus assembly protein PilO
MTRTLVLLSALAAILLIALSWMFLFQPRNAEIADLQAETQNLESQAQQLQARITALQQVREASPDYEAQLAAAYAVVPRETALPAMLRQLQLAADESGLTLMTVSPSRPAAVTLEGGATGLSAINIAVDIEGRYFQLVDFLRRLEDPSISPRGLRWNSLNVGGDLEDYPSLTASLQGDLYALLPTVSVDDTAAPEATDDANDVDAEADGDSDQEQDQ